MADQIVKANQDDSDFIDDVKDLSVLKALDRGVSPERFRLQELAQHDDSLGWMDSP